MRNWFCTALVASLLLPTIAAAQSAPMPVGTYATRNTDALRAHRAEWQAEHPSQQRKQITRRPVAQREVTERRTTTRRVRGQARLHDYSGQVHRQPNQSSGSHASAHKSTRQHTRLESTANRLKDSAKDSLSKHARALRR